MVVALGLDEVIHLEVLLCPDEVPTELVHQHLVRRGDGVEVRDIFVGADLALGDDGLRFDGALARHEVHIVAAQTALTDADTRAVFHIDISLIEVGLYAEGDLTAHLYEEATADIGEGSGVVA